MINLNLKLLTYLKNQNHINPNSCQVSVVSVISEIIQKSTRSKLFTPKGKSKLGVYVHGSVGTGKSVIIKALNLIHPKSEMLHFSELIFNLQSKNIKNQEYLKRIKKQKLIIIDEFFINNLTSLILFRSFLKDIKNLKVPVVMSGNKTLNKIYDDPVNQKLCQEIKEEFHEFFVTQEIKSKIDYRLKDKVNHNFFLIKKKNKLIKQNLLVKQLSSLSSSVELEFKRRGNSFKIKKTYGNLIDIKFEDFFNKNLVFQDYELISKKIKIFIIRDIKQMDENSKNLVARFISFIDVFYENKNILSISSNVELDKLYVGNTNFEEFKRTISRLREMGSDHYININLKKLLKKS